MCLCVIYNHKQIIIVWLWPAALSSMRIYEHFMKPFCHDYPTKKEKQKLAVEIYVHMLLNSLHIFKMCDLRTYDNLMLSA